MFHGAGPRTRRLLSFLHRREHQRGIKRTELDRLARKALFRPRGIVFTDTSDFTARTARDGIVHFLMLFNRLVEAAGPVLRATRGRVVKVEADSLLLDFPGVDDACHGVIALEKLLRKLNTGRPAHEKLEFGYGVGFGEVLDIERDLFGLEVNLASKIGEDMARPGEVLLTPAASASRATRPRGSRSRGAR